MMPATTLGGRNRQRMKWTDEINIELLRCYYTVTNLETNLTAYRPLLHRMFVQKYPELNFITEQRISDQIRVIHRNNRIPATTREKIKKTIEETINRENNEHSENTTQNTLFTNIQDNNTTEEETNTDTQTAMAHLYTQYTQNSNDTETLITEHQITPSQQMNIENENHTQLEYEKIYTTFTELLIKFKGTDPTLRPHIPKLQTCRKTIKTVNTINQIIKAYLQNNDDTTIENLHDIIYCAAKTVTTLHIEKNNLNKKNIKRTETTENKPAWQKRIETKIAKLRKEIGQLTQHLNGKLSQKKQEKIKVNGKDRNEVVEELDKNKQKLAAQSKRLRRYKLSNLLTKVNSSRHMLDSTSIPKPLIIIPIGPPKDLAHARLRKPNTNES
ncbi:unnamed protein product, partial [Brenthis ino]